MNLEIRFAPGRLRQARRAAGLSQEGLARAVDVTTGVIQNAESGRHVPSAETVAAIASVLGIAMERLFDRATAAA